jgi:hypothetical protein
VKKTKKKKERKPKLNKVHYVCIGKCGIESNEPGKCTTFGCPRHRNPLSECHCTDGKHKERLS